MKDILNLKIKRRESFRPFAPSVLRDAVPEWFEQDGDVPFMMEVYQIRAEKRPLIPAVTHVDGSGRLQTVYAHTNPRRWCASRRRRWIASCGRRWMCWCWGMWWCGGPGELQRGAMAQFLGESAGLSGCRARCVGVALLPANSHGCANGAVFMPELSRFLGIVIAMYYRDHNPPHFHAVYGECEATFNISTGEVNGFLPTSRGLIQEWRQFCISRNWQKRGHLQRRGNRCLISLHWSEQNVASSFGDALSGSYSVWLRLKR